MDKTPEINENHERCLNCGHSLSGDYCGNCGQEAKDLRRPLFKLSREAIQSLFELDGRAYRTLFYLLTKPAFLCTEYFDGRRTRYSPPLRLFLVISVSFFLLVSFYTSVQSIENALSESEEVAGEDIAASVDDDALSRIGTDVNVEDDPFSSFGDDFGDEFVDENDGENDLEGILAFVDKINLPFFDAQANVNLRRVMRAQAEENVNVLLENPTEFLRGYLEYVTFFMLLMIPLLAFIQKIIYIRTGHYYVEHLVLTLHNNAFIILIVFVNTLTDMVATSELPFISPVFGYLGTAGYIWMWVYLYMSLKNYFQQGYGITLLKYITATILYGMTLAVGIFIFSGILFFLF